MDTKEQSIYQHSDLNLYLNIYILCAVKLITTQNIHLVLLYVET